MTPEAQIIVQATNYIMQSIVMIYGLLATAMGLISAGMLIGYVEQMYFDFRYKSPVLERASTITKGCLAVCGLVLALVILL